MATLPASVADFRKRYRAEEISARYSGPAHLAFTSLSCLAIIGWALSGLSDVSAAELAWVPGVFLYINFAEYLGHRGPMHHPTRGLRILFERHTMQHHRFFTHEAMAFEGLQDFKMVLFPPAMILFFGLGYAAPLGWIISQWVSPNAGRLFFATVFAYFLNYEWLHFAYHCSENSWIGRQGIIRKLRRLHTIHHDPRLMTRHNFNITYPIADLVFGSLYRGKGPG